MKKLLFNFLLCYRVYGCSTDDISVKKFKLSEGSAFSFFRSVKLIEKEEFARVQFFLMEVEAQKSIIKLTESYSRKKLQIKQLEDKKLRDHQKEIAVNVAQLRQEFNSINVSLTKNLSNSLENN